MQLPAQHQRNDLVELPNFKPSGWIPGTALRTYQIDDTEILSSLYANEIAATDAKDLKLTEKMKDLLHKLSMETFQVISNQFLELPINSTSLLEELIELLFFNALDEHHCQTLYGRLCERLFNGLPLVQKRMDSDVKTNNFRRLLLTKCREEFERGLNWDTNEALSREEQDLRKRRFLRNITFIGELFKVQIVFEKTMHICVQQLLNKVVETEEEETECLCKLLKSVGERLDHPAAKSHMDLYFTRIKELSVNQKLPARIRFMIQDLIEQRRSKWKARIEVVGPMKISEIQEREDKKQREEEAIRQRNASGGGGGRGGRGGRVGQAFGRQNSTSDRSGKSQDVRSQADGWNTVAEEARSTRRVDNLNNFGKSELKKPSIGLHFGLPSSTWNRGTQGGTARDEAEKPRAAATGGNMFSVLSAAENVSEREKSIELFAHPPRPILTRLLKPRLWRPPLLLRSLARAKPTRRLRPLARSGSASLTSPNLLRHKRSLERMSTMLSFYLRC
ncbi:armadillo-type protein [Chytridium lagenaria]|nr:armadillo-type protein [Chytridium lagenaria]